MPVLPDLAQRLQLTPMVQERPDQSAPRFAVPIDHVTCKSGISPWERAYTMQCMLNPGSRPEDFMRPGHVFPLIARPEGVLRRTGHTEAAVDLARLAGLTPAGVLCEVCSRDGYHMADRTELAELAAEFRLPMITIDDLVEFRRREERPLRPAAVPVPVAVYTDGDVA
jgi:3,4-dihydroxy 2-butanone 4-phosphate synthase/GTP cyclohydrolase II